MKKIDRLVLVSFIGPFLVTFSIATFVLLMQILWVYIDDIAGKGLGMFVIIELLAYKCVGLVPMAMPLAILISSVMVLGGLAERYELSSFKSAGVSLLRVMRPLIIFGIFAMGASYLVSNYVIPVANLKFGSRMYDIQQKKPSLSLEAGIFNDDFGNYAIRIGEKGQDGRSIQDILIYDHTDANSGKLGQVIAEKGQMFSTPDGNYFIMELENGHQYIETRPSRSNKDGSFPYIRTSFKSWNKVFDLSEFNLQVTDSELFKHNRSMLSISQLKEAIDSIQAQIDRRYLSLANHVANYYTPFTPDSLYQQQTAPQEEDDGITAEAVKEDSTAMAKAQEGKPDSVATDSVPKPEPKRANALAQKPLKPQRTNRISPRRPRPDKVVSSPQVDSNRVRSLLPIERYADTVPDLATWLSVLRTVEQKRFVTKAKSAARGILSQAESAVSSIDRTRENKVKHIYEMHTKYSMAVVCIIFVFVGAPLGAIVRKGGFGYPLLISVIAFILFVVLTIFCRKIAETFIVPAAVAAWLPCIILFPIGVWLTTKAMNDSKLFDLTKVGNLFRRLRSRKSVIHAPAS